MLNTSKFFFVVIKNVGVFSLFLFVCLFLCFLIESKTMHITHLRLAGAFTFPLCISV